MLESSPVICQLTRSALSEVMEIDAEVAAVPWSRSVFRREFENEVSRIFGARESGILVAYLCCQVVVDECHILSIGVRKARQGRGIGGALLTEAMLRLYETGTRRAFLEVRVSNLKAHRLYSRAGFVERGVRERYYTDNDEDAVVMEANLQFVVDLMRKRKGNSGGV